MDDSFFQAVKWLELCNRNGITLNPEKFGFARDIVEFAGFEIKSDNACPCEEFLWAIHEFSESRNITDIHSWFEQVTKEHMLPLHFPLAEIDLYL